MFILIRAATYATLFIGFFLFFLPNRILSLTSIVRPAGIDVPQAAGILMALVGTALVVACILTFVFVGKGTQAPFDPPVRLVMRGPYRLIRNPMYLGATLVLCGAALFYQSMWLLLYAAAFFLLTNLFVVMSEEPGLSHTFGRDYDAYRRRVGRWWPKTRGF